MNWRIRTYLSLLRAHHWVKNLFLFAAPFFGGKLFDDRALTVGLPAFIGFSLCTSAVYVINDIRDRQRDLLHPRKRHRPVAAGLVSTRRALTVGVTVMACSIAISLRIGSSFLFFVLLYVAIQTAYSFCLKNVVIADIFCVASGFVIRVLAGGAAFNIEVSKWLFLTMFLVSLVLATGKRLAEIQVLSDDAAVHRESLSAYSAGTLNDILIVGAAASLIAYSLYTVEQFGDLIYTVPVVTFGLFRYIVVARQGMGDPTEAMTKDVVLALTVGVWLVFVGLIRYRW